MLFVIDIGNTHTVLGIFRDDCLLCDWRIHTDKNITEDELSVLIRHLFSGVDLALENIRQTVISSVVPSLDRIYANFCKKYLNCEPLWVNAAAYSGISICYGNPSEVGADRIVNAAAAYEKYKTRMIVVDFGTATTFDLISEKGEYQGGLIVPGVVISSEALFENAAKLPRVDLLTRPATVLGTDTAESIKSGIIYGYASLVDGLVDRIQKETGDTFKVIATGGVANLIADASETIEAVEPNLTLEGLKIIGNAQSA